MRARVWGSGCARLAEFVKPANWYNIDHAGALKVRPEECLPPRTREPSPCSRSAGAAAALMEWEEVVCAGLGGAKGAG